MLEKLEAILDRFAELDRRLAEAGSDFQLMADLSKERSDLEPIANLAREYKANL
ncbi:MAG: peptide chain release factor 1, partial [Chloroflexi bacterium]|nr:peptide chain release factor 1 [Chloroflexota bacterium]